ncbi:MAG: right-handed parallel beta-helix repeat-containing protein [Methanobacteriaceae archaeon]
MLEINKIVLIASILMITLSINTALLDDVNGSNNVINIDSGLTNVQIQSIMDNAPVGSTVNFLGDSYSDISIIINKKLNIISSSNTKTVITGSSVNNPELDQSFTFYFTENSSGSKIEGFILDANGDYGILIKNAKNIAITNNIIKNSVIDGIHLKNSENISIAQNEIFNNPVSGIAIVESSKNINMINNSLYWNGNGIKINTTTTSNVIIGNNIYNQVYHEVYDGSRGNGIFYEEGYDTTGGISTLIEHNRIAYNPERTIKVDNWEIVFPNGNWYGSNNKGTLNFCSNIKGFEAITVALIETEKGFEARFYDGDKIAKNLPLFITYFKLNDGVKEEIYTVNGIATFTKTALKGDKITFNVDNNKSMIITIGEAQLSTSSKLSSSSITNGKTTTYIINIKNNGDRVAKNINISNILPNNLNIISKSGGGKFSNNIWSINSIQPGETANLVLNVKATKSGTFKSKIKVDATDLNTIYGTQATLNVKKSINLKYSQSISKTKVKVGSYVYIRTKVTNNGLDKSNVVTVRNKVPKGLKGSTISSSSKFNEKTNQWNINVAGKKSTTLSMKIKVNKKGNNHIPIYLNGKKWKTVVVKGI